MRDTIEAIPERTSAAALERYMPMPPVSISTELFPEWTSMRAAMYRLPPGEARLPAIENLRMTVHLSARSSHVERVLDGVATEVQPSLDSVNFIPANHAIHWHWDGFIEILQMQLTGNFIGRIAREYNLDAQRMLALDLLNVRDPIISQIAHEVAEIMQSGQQDMDIRYLDSMATFLALHLQQRYVRDTWGGDNGGKCRVSDFSRVVEYIHDNLDKDLRLEQIAKIANLSNFYFIKLFKSAFGKPPHQYILDCRIELAKRLLLGTFLPISEVSLRCGFSTQSHFTNAFRRHTGTAPRAFRHTHGVETQKN